MKTVNSLSGGKTSSYIAMHYPADYNVFALVHSSDRSLTPSDPDIVKYASNKIGKEFIGTLEANETLYILRELEQMIGKEIIWTVGVDFDEIISKRGVPNKMWRFCTTEMKMHPIFDWWLQNVGDIIKMRIGFRLDEFERSERLTTTMKYRRSQKLTGEKRYEWDEIQWRVGDFPLIDDRLTIRDIVKYWSDSSLKFPNSSNCVGCFWKSDYELRQNWDEYPEKMEWFARMEREKNATFKTGITYDQILKTPKQTEMFFGGGSCQSDGYCTD